MNFFESSILQHLPMMLCRLNTSPDDIKCFNDCTVPLINPSLSNVLIVICKYADVLKLDPPTRIDCPSTFVTKRKSFTNRRFTHSYAVSINLGQLANEPTIWRAWDEVKFLRECPWFFHVIDEEFDVRRRHPVKKSKPFIWILKLIFVLVPCGLDRT